MNNQTPGGVRDYLPGETEPRDRILADIENSFKSQNYEKVITPTLEYYNAIKHALAPKIKDTCIKFPNTEGEILVLRPDPTATLARIAATRLKGHQKLYYIAPVFRNIPGETEALQAGIERVGEDSPEADADIIITLIKTLNALNIKDFTIDIGHQDYASALAPEKQSALLTGDYITYGALPERGPAELISDNRRLTEIAKILKSQNQDDKITYNKTQFKDPDYYTGMTLDAVIPGIGKVIASGGRYDNLIEKFGAPAPAVGMAITLSRLWGGQK